MDFEPHYQADKNVWGEQPSGVIAEHANLLHPGSVLDLGAGDGRNAVYLARAGFDVTAVDVAPTGLANLREKAETAGVEVQTIEANLLDVELDQTYDNIITHFTLHFVGGGDNIKAALAKMAAATNPGGVNIVDDFTPTDMPPAQAHNYPSAATVEEFYMSLGWEILLKDTRQVRLGFAEKSDPRQTREALALIARRPTS